MYLDVERRRPLHGEAAAATAGQRPSTHSTRFSRLSSRPGTDLRTQQALGWR